MILLLTLRLTFLPTLRLATRCEVRLSSAGVLSACTFADVAGFFGSIFFSLISCLQGVRGVDDTQHHPRRLVCHPADTGCVNLPTFGAGTRMSTTVDVWEAL